MMEATFTLPSPFEKKHIMEIAPFFPSLTLDSYVIKLKGGGIYKFGLKNTRPPALKIF